MPLWKAVAVRQPGGQQGGVQNLGDGDSEGGEAVTDPLLLGGKASLLGRGTVSQ